jgi:polyferredoxin
MRVPGRCITALLMLAILLLSLPGEALAHGFGVRYDIPVPFWLYAYGAAAAVVLTFVLLVDTKPAPHRYPRFDLLQVGWFRAVFASRPLLLGVRLVSVALFSLVILSGLFGDQTPESNLAPTFVWIIWWVGLAFFTVLLGNLWELVNPWKILFEWAQVLAPRLRKGQYLPYPVGWGVWPALVLYFGFAWVELVFLGSSRPSNIAVLALLYSAITLAGMALFGKEAWLRGGEAFSVFFGILARFAPTEVRVTDPDVCKGCDAPCQNADGGCVNCYGCFAKAPPKTASSTCAPRRSASAALRRSPRTGLRSSSSCSLSSPTTA